MRKVILSVLLCVCLMGTALAGSLDAFPDVPDNWAYSALEAAVTAGIIQGLDDGTLSPGAPVTGAQALTMLNRVLGLEVGEVVPGEPWYAPAERTAAAAGFLPTWEDWDASKPLTRARTFVLLSGAFSLHTTQTDCLAEFQDADGLTGEEAWAAAGIVLSGAAQGSSGSLRPESQVTRAEFATLLYRLTGLGQGGAILEPDAETAVRRNEDMESGLLTQPETTSISLQNLEASGPVVLRGDRLDKCILHNVTAPRLILATGGSDISIAKGDFGSLQIGSGDSDVKLANKITPVVEVFGDGREINLSDMKLERLVVAGSGNTIVVNSRTDVAQLQVVAGAENNVIHADGDVETALVLGRGTILEGSGEAGLVQVAAPDVQVTLDAETLQYDAGLTGITVTLDAPVVQAGNPIQVTAAISGVDMEKVAKAQWYLDGKAVQGYSNPSYTLVEGGTSSLLLNVSYSKYMTLSHTAAFTLEYENSVTGELESLTVEAPVQIQNHPDSYYQAQNAALAAQVSSTYAGDYTMNYNIDYSREVKEAFVNHNNYKSSTNYLLWVSRATQKVNVFTGSQGNWTLLNTYRCGTGAPGMSTPVGVTYVTYKQPAWHMGSYNVYWITRFYPNTGYAFHSRGYYANNPSVAMYPDIGYPMSHGCVRLYDDAAIWIHQNIPLNTTVVIY